MACRFDNTIYARMKSSIGKKKKIKKERMMGGKKAMLNG